MVYKGDLSTEPRADTAWSLVAGSRSPPPSVPWARAVASPRFGVEPERSPDVKHFQGLRLISGFSSRFKASLGGFKALHAADHVFASKPGPEVIDVDSLDPGDAPGRSPFGALRPSASAPAAWLSTVGSGCHRPSRASLAWAERPSWAGAEAAAARPRERKLGQRS